MKVDSNGIGARKPGAAESHVVADEPCRFGVGDSIDGRYRVIAVLSPGAHDALYHVEHVGGATLALRVLSAEVAQDRELVEHLGARVSLVRRLAALTPVVSFLHEVVRAADGALLIPMEYTEAPTLAALVERDGPLAPERALELASVIGEALQTAHNILAIHGHLSPENVLVPEDGHTVRLTVRLIQFGLPRRFAPRAASPTGGSILGRPASSAYMAPEQARGAPAGERGDVYSLGALLSLMLTGVAPRVVMADPRTGMPSRTAHGFAIVAKMRRRIPAGLRRVVAQATDADPDRRHRDMSNLLVDLYVQRGRRAGALPRARRIVIPEKLFAAGSKLAAIAAILGAALTLVFVGWGIWDLRGDARPDLSRKASPPAAARSPAGPEPAPAPREASPTAREPSPAEPAADATARPAAPLPAREAAPALPSSPPPEPPTARPSPPPPPPVIAAPSTTTDVKGPAPAERPRAPEPKAPRAAAPAAPRATTPRPAPTEAGRPASPEATRAAPTEASRAVPPPSAPARDTEDPRAIIDWLLNEGAAQRRAPSGLESR